MVAIDSEGVGHYFRTAPVEPDGSVRVALWWGPAPRWASGPRIDFTLLFDFVTDWTAFVKEFYSAILAIWEKPDLESFLYEWYSFREELVLDGEEEEPRPVLPIVRSDILDRLVGQV